MSQYTDQPIIPFALNETLLPDEELEITRHGGGLGWTIKIRSLRRFREIHNVILAEFGNSPGYTKVKAEK